MITHFDLPVFHFPVSDFLVYAGKSDKQKAEAYAKTQLECFIEEAEEIIETFDKGLSKHPRHVYEIADDIADTHFSGIGFLYTVNFDIGHGCIYEDYQDYLDLIEGDNRDWAIDDLVFIIKNEVKNIKGILGKKYTSEDVINQNAVLSKLCCRIMATATKLGQILSLDSEECLRIVCEANLNKFDDTLRDAETSVEAYRDKGIVVKAVCVGQSVWAIVSTEEQTVDGKLYPKNKILKSHKWSEPVFDHLRHLLEI